ncbi:hypothetical protein Trydic_g19685 [Trypoxylus dichotomus]
MVQLTPSVNTDKIFLQTAIHGVDLIEYLHIISKQYLLTMQSPGYIVNKDQKKDRAEFSPLQKMSHRDASSDDDGETETSKCLPSDESNRSSPQESDSEEYGNDSDDDRIRIYYLKK